MLLAICLVILAGPFYVSGEGTVLTVLNGQNYSNPMFNFSLSSSYNISDFTSKVNVTKYSEIWIYVHGYEYGLNPNETKLINAMSQNKTDYLIISVDYDYYFYTTALEYVPSVGETVATFLSMLHNSTGYSLGKIGCVGHSLGAHITGVIGSTLNSTLNSKLKFMVGLDPAGPFITILDSIKLKSGDAQYVEAFHTTSLLGTKLLCGDSDFFFNGAIEQPDCLEATYNGENVEECSHLKSIGYFHDSLFNGANYTGYPPFSLFDDDSAYAGRFQLDTHAEGRYDVTT